MNKTSQLSSLARPLALGTALLSTLFFAACGSSDSSSSGPGPEEELPSIVEIATTNEDFTTLAAALEAADLVDALSGEGPFTVFAPTDAVFAGLPEGTLETLLADPDGLLKDILLYHVVSGKVESGTVVTLSSATTLLSQDISIAVVDGKVILNGNIEVVTVDVQASNGVIHIIDGVLIPPTAGPGSSSSNTPSSSSVAASSSSGPGTIVDIASANADFSTLVTAVVAAGLAETLASEGPFTVFAPTNAAFAALPEGTLEALLADPEGDLKDILLYHVVSGKVESGTVVTLSSATTVFGEDVSIAVVDGKVILNGTVEVTAVDIQASNGVIHVLDAVLLPPAE